MVARRCCPVELRRNEVAADENSVGVTGYA